MTNDGNDRNNSPSSIRFLYSIIITQVFRIGRKRGKNVIKLEHSHLKFAEIIKEWECKQRESFVARSTYIISVYVLVRFGEGTVQTIR